MDFVNRFLKNNFGILNFNFNRKSEIGFWISDLGFQFWFWGWSQFSISIFCSGA